SIKNEKPTSEQTSEHVKRLVIRLSQVHSLR
ncbi:MAG: hypothetical protein ACI95X_002772, partial [Paraglaciecola sp.]